MTKHTISPAIRRTSCTASRLVRCRRWRRPKEVVRLPLSHVCAMQWQTSTLCGRSLRPLSAGRPMFFGPPLHCGIDSLNASPVKTPRPSGESSRMTVSRRFAWREVAPGIECKVLATDPGTDRVSMLVRLAPGIEYPAHRHAGLEELHLLHGELMINDRKLAPGDYYRGEPGTSDTYVSSPTGCTCVLMTSLGDELH